MKLGCVIGLLLAVGCSSRPPRPAAAPVEPAGDLVARLRVEPEYRPPPAAPDRVSTFTELPRGAWIARGWAEGCWAPGYPAVRVPACAPRFRRCGP